MTAGSGAVPAEAFPKSWYGFTGDNHFWMQWRFKVWLRRMEEQGVDLAGPARAFDVGCGVGTFSRQVEAASGWTVDGADTGEALALARRGRGRAMALDIFSFPADMLEAYDHVFLFDVIEHVADPRAFVGASLRYLKPGGLLHVNVPAVQSLFSNYDRAVGHLRRYDVKGLRATVDGLGLASPRAGYWGMSLLPYLLARKLFLRGSGGGEDVVRRGINPPGRIADRIARAQMAVETALGSSMAIGASLMLTARKES